MGLSEEKRAELKKAIAEGQAYNDLFFGRGRFKDTGRQSSGYGEALDSVLGAPARLGVSELQNGNFNLDTAGKVWNQIGKDPQTAPTGYDVASKVTDNPYLGTALATAVDAGAQLPVGMLGKAGKLTGLVGKLEDISPGAKALIESIKTPEQAAALKGADREKYLSALDEVHGPREQRAKDMGFGGQTYYHGTNSDIDQFRHEKLGSHTGEGTTKDKFWFTDQPETADAFASSAAKLNVFQKYNNNIDQVYRAKADVYNKLKSSLGDNPEFNLDKLLKNQTPRMLETYKKYGDLNDAQIDLIKQHEDFRDLIQMQEAEKSYKGQNSSGNVIPVKLRDSKIPEKDMGGAYWSDSASNIPEGEIKLNNFHEDHPYSGHPLGTSVGILNPSKIRSTNAAFDPRFKDSANLLAGQAGPVGSLPLNTSPNQGQKQMASKPAFDPNKPFTEADAAQKPAFDPSKPFHPMANDIQAISQEPGMLGQEAHSAVTPQTALNALPIAGGIGGGILGGMAGLASPVPGGAFIGEYGGAGAGSAAGEAAKYAGEKYLLGKDMSKEDLGKRMAVSGAAGMLGQGAGNLMNVAGKSFVNSGVQDVAQTLAKPGAQQIANAATQLKVKPTQGMMTNDYMVRNLEDSLGQSPSIPGGAIRAEQQPVRDAIQGAANDAVKDQSMQSDVDAGKALKSGVNGYFEKRYDPISQSYNEIESHTKNIPLNPQGLRRISNNIRGLDEAKFSGSDAHKVANKFANWLEEAENVNDIKILKTKARQIAQDPNSSFEEKSVASSIMGKLDQAQTNSITRQAVQIAREAPVTTTSQGKFLNAGQKEVAGQEATAEGENLGKKLVGDIKNTNAQYKGLMQDAKTFGKGSGLTKANKGMSATLEDINNAKPEEMASALFDQNNSEFTQFVKEKMPEQFELARQQKLAQIVKQTGGDTNKILKLSEKMGPEVREMLFGKDNVQNLGAANTLLKAIPGKVGASDTPRGMAFNSVLSPTGLMQNITDAGRYGLLKGKAKLPAAGMLMQKARYPVQGLVNKGLIDERQD